ncbi:AAA family ATPase [Enterococcus asini]|uniref:AAA family ATPase n=1 Tax=Enterococcus asini TaxID=57732 RepID=UPI0022E7790F|nr:AAA family ATPase [Enterococcus asini]
MTTIKINRIDYKNFKGLQDFKLTLGQRNGVVSGVNGSGKTTLADGLLWLLFGKDSRGAKLNPKPLNERNEEILGLEPTVEAKLIIDGESVTLKRVQEEKWTNPKGQLEKVRGSDTTKYFINKVPAKEKEWKEYLAGLGDETTLQILADSAFFMRLPWKTRREILVNTTDLTDETIINGDPELTELPAILDRHTVDDTRKILASQKKEIKRQIDGVPARIQEVTDMKAKQEEAIGDLDKSELQMAVLETQAEISDLEGKLDVLKSGDASLNYQTELSQAQLKLSEAERQYLADTNLQTQTLQEDVMDKQTEVNDLRRKKMGAEAVVLGIKDTINSLTDKKADLLAEYKKYKDTTFDDHRATCPTCGQSLPEDKVEQMISDFNKRKSDFLEKNIASGKALKDELITLENDKSMAESRLSEVIGQLEKAQSSLDLINNELVQTQSGISPFKETAKAKKIQAEIDLINQKIKTASLDTSEAEMDLWNQIDGLRAVMADMQAKYQSFEQLSSFDERINQLKAEDKRLKDQNQDVERKLWLLDEFTRKKVAALEESINSKFGLVRWKLFNILKNGGLEEVCEATYNGIEYGTSLNTGARINCDLDIVNTLGKEFGIQMPVFVDNTESVTKLHEVEAQTIDLRVGTTKKLKVEVAE